MLGHPLKFLVGVTWPAFRRIALGCRNIGPALRQRRGLFRCLGEHDLATIVRVANRAPYRQIEDRKCGKDKA
jgi:hypothetical protein